MTLGKPRNARTEQVWRLWIEKWRASGRGVRAFCALHGLAEPSFYAWRRELLRRDAEQSAFVPVRVVATDVRLLSSSSSEYLPACRSSNGPLRKAHVWYAQLGNDGA